MERLISVFADGELKVESQNPASQAGDYYRAPHDTERNNVDLDDFGYISSKFVKGFVRKEVIQRNVPLPEVYRFQPFHRVTLTASLQRLWRGINPELSDEKWSSLLDYKLAWCNESGFGDPNKPHANHITGENLGSPDPYFDFARFCGGAIFKGEVEGSNLRVFTIPPVVSISPQFILNNPHLWYYGTSISPRGYIYYIRRMGIDGTMKRVRIPLITAKTVTIPLRELHRLPDGFMPEAAWTHYL